MVLAPITLSQTVDTWKWPLNPDGQFRIKFFVANMGDQTQHLEKELTKGI